MIALVFLLMQMFDFVHNAATFGYRNTLLIMLWLLFGQG